MSSAPLLPHAASWKDAQGRPLPVEFFRFLGDLQRFVRDAGGSGVAGMEELAARIATLEEGQSIELRGVGSITIRSGLVMLLADQESPTGNAYYGTNAQGQRGFWPVVDAIQAGYGLDKEPFSPYVVLGTLDDPTELPTSAAVDDAYLIDGNYWAWDGTSWSNVGPPSNIALLNVHRGIEADDGLLWNPTSIDYDVGPIVRNPMTTTGDMIYADPGKTPSRLPIGSNGHVLTVESGKPAWRPATGGGRAIICASFDGASAALQPGALADVYVPYGFEIEKVVVLADPAGGVSIDIRRCPRATYPPTTADTICGGSPPEIVTGQQAVITSFPGWTTTIDADSAFRFVVLTASSVTRATLQIEGTKL